VRLYGEYARYTWGLAPTSGRAAAGRARESPVPKPGYYGASTCMRRRPVRRFGVTFIREEISRDDALVRGRGEPPLRRDARQVEGRRSSRRTRASPTTQVFFYYNDLENPFPELSAIKPISGPDADKDVKNYKYDWAWVHVLIGGPEGPPLPSSR